MNYSPTIVILLWLGYIVLIQGRPATHPKATTTKRTHVTVKKSLHLHKSGIHHGKSHKRHLRKKKQYIMGGFGTGGLAGAGGYGGYGVPDYSSLALANSQSYGYPAATSTNNPYGGLAALGGDNTQSTLYAPSLTPSTGDLQSRQSLLGSYGGTADQALSSYDPNGLSAYANTGLQDASSLSNSMAPLGYVDQTGLSNSLADQTGLSNSLTNAMASSLSNTLGNSLSNSLGNSLSNSLGSSLSNRPSNSFSNSLSNSFSSNLGSSLSNNLATGLSNGVNSYAGGDASQMSGLNGYNSLTSNYNPTASDISNTGGKYAAESLSASLDTPNGITNIANLLNSAQASFDADSQGQVLGSSQGLGSKINMNKVGQRFGNQASFTQQPLGMSSYGQQSSLTAAEAQSFENQLGHLSNSKLKLPGNSHANYFGDNIDSGNLNEIGQIASTGISDSSLQKILGQLMAGQFGHGNSNHLNPSMPTDSSMGTFGNGANSESMGSDQLSDEQGFGSLVAPIIHGQTIRVHASDKPRYQHADKNHASASKTATGVQEQARKEHHQRLLQLKDKLKMLREKLRRLKQEYNDDDDDNTDDTSDVNEMTSDLTEKSEMETLSNLKSATEEALKELKREMNKVKEKGNDISVANKLTKSSDGHSGETEETIEDIEKEMMQLIDDNHEIINNKINKKLAKKPKQDTEKHLSLAELDKQAEQEVDFLTNENSKVVNKKEHPKLHKQIQNAQNPAVHINIPEPVDDDDLDEELPQIKKHPTHHGNVTVSHINSAKPTVSTKTTNRITTRHQ